MVANNAKADSAPIKPSNEMWCKPNEGFLNLNVDASFHIEEGVGAAGAIIRDHKDNFVAASTTDGGVKLLQFLQTAYLLLRA
jgi:hypothetical protein